MGYRTAGQGVLERLEPRVLLAAVPPNDPLYVDQWHLNNTGQRATDFNVGYDDDGTPGVDIDAELAWKITAGESSRPIVVAILDTGLALNHPDFQGKIFQNPDEIPGNNIDDDGNGFIDDVSGWDFSGAANEPGGDDADVTDFEGHGTHVAGIAAALGNNAEGVAGVAWDPNVQILPLKVFGDDGSGSFDAVINAVNYVADLARRGINIVAANASLGGGQFPFPRALSRAVERLGELGVTFVVAAGNDRLDVDPSTFFPAKLSLNLPNVITVAATDNRDQLADFTNFGFASVQVAAPGVAITSTWPLELDILDEEQDGYHVISGTSMAAPVVTGLIALMKAAVPDASVAQIRQALFAGVDHIEAAEGPFSLPPAVTTVGRVNAFRAIQNLQNPFAGTDDAAQGDWGNRYGSQGVFIPGTTPLLPGNVTLHGGIVEVLKTNSKNRSAVFEPGGASRIESYYATTGGMTIDFDFEPNQIHRVGLYFADYDRQNRAQLVHLIRVDEQAGTATIVSSQVVSDFQKGKYLFWDVEGHVQLHVVSLSGDSAVFSGLFIDPRPTAEHTFVSRDDATQGRWKDAYGAEGAFIVGDSTAVPDFADMTVIGGITEIVRSVTRDPRALQKTFDVNRNVAARFASSTEMTIDLNLTDAQTHRVTLHMVDFDKKNRSQRIEIIDPDTGFVLSRRDVSNFKNGTYLTWELSGHKQIRLVNLGGPSAVVSGVFFDTLPEADVRFVGSDRSTQGTWKGMYGSDGAYVIGDPAARFPDFVEAGDLMGGSTFILRPSTADRSALQKANSIGDRVVGYFVTRTFMQFELNFTDQRTHRVALYMVDAEKARRTQRVEILDAEGNTLLSRPVSDFSKGAYLIFDLRGEVQVRITNFGVSSAVLSGIFFD